MAIKFPQKFVDRYSSIVDDEKAFFSCLCEILPRAFRINNIKGDKKEVLENFQRYGIDLESVPWYTDAFITNSKSIGNTIEHFMGHIYVQELTSMIPPLILFDQQIPRKFHTAQIGTVLDAAAAPGSKTTQMADLMGNTGCIVANDSSYMRTKSLKFNLEKLGVVNTVITNYDFRRFPGNMRFDRILLDAPCSSEGTIRKNPNVMDMWSLKTIFKISRLQKSLILRAFDLLEDGGTLVYSTCTFGPEENEGVVDYLLENRNGAELETVNVDGLKLSSGITKFEDREFNPDVERCRRIWPHHNNTGGFFITKIRK